MSAKLTYDAPREPTVKELLEDAAETIGDHTHRENGV